MSNRYSQRGVSAQKEDVHKAIKKIDKPQASQSNRYKSISTESNKGISLDK